MTAITTSACVTVAKGGVGESGASSQLIHQVKCKIAKLMVLKTVQSVATRKLNKRRISTRYTFGERPLKISLTVTGFQDYNQGSIPGEV